MRICDHWAYLPGTEDGSECPIKFSEEETRKQTEDDEMWCNLNALVEHWRSELGGISEEGWVRSEEYEHAIRRNQSLIEKFSKDGSEDELAKLERGWPFKDCEEFF